MPEFKAELDRMNWLWREGKISADEPCKVVLPRLEAKKRVRNSEGRTRLIVQLDTAETYSEFAAEFARYKEETGNPQIAFQLMLTLLKAPSNEDLQRYAKGAQNAQT